MPSVFPDVNVLLALFLEGHQHHVSAKTWFAARDTPQLVLCRVTQLGFLRLVTTQAVARHDVVTNAEAWGLMEQIMLSGAAILASEPAHMDGNFRMLSDIDAVAPKRWSDAYVSSFSVLSALPLVTFDVALAGYTPRSILLRP